MYALPLCCHRLQTDVLCRGGSVMQPRLCLLPAVGDNGAPSSVHIYVFDVLFWVLRELITIVLLLLVVGVVWYQYYCARLDDWCFMR